MKPKTTPSADDAGATSVSNTQTADNASESVEFDKTQANENSDVVRSELKSLRQSAVAMSVSQKDGANQIVQDWLDTEGGEESDENQSDDSDDQKS